jgi:hypothetical protein
MISLGFFFGMRGPLPIKLRRYPAMHYGRNAPRFVPGQSAARPC